MYKKLHMFALSFALIIVILLPISIIPAYAATQSDLLFTLSEPRNMAVTVSYDKEKPVISFISPDGIEYTENRIPEWRMRTEHFEGAVCYYIIDARPGDWTIVYDKLSNTELDVTYASYAEAVIIEEFVIESVANNRARVNFEASYISDLRYNYIIYTVTLGQNSEISGQREMLSGTASANELISIDISLNQLADYNNYYLMLEVYAYSGGFEVSDIAVSESGFSIVNNNASASIKDFYTYINLTDGSVVVDWSNYTVNCDEYILAAFTSDNPSEPVYTNTFDSGITLTEFLFDLSISSISIELSYKSRDMVSQTLRKDIELDNSIDIKITTPDETNSAQAVIEYKTEREQAVLITVNNVTETAILNGSGSFSVAISEYDNEISILYESQENIAFIITGLIYSDRTSPILLLYENSTNINIEESIFAIAGATEPGCKITVNGIEIEVNSDGTFLYDLSLEDGENSFLIISSDPAGNSSAQTVLINKLKQSNIIVGENDKTLFEKYLPLIISFLCGAFIVILSIIFTRLYNKKKSVFGHIYAVISLIRNILIVLTCGFSGAAICGFIIRQSYDSVNSAEFFDIVQDSVQKAYKALIEFDMYNSMLIWTGIAASVCIIIAILLSIILHFIKKQKRNIPSEETTEQLSDNKPAPCEDKIPEALSVENEKQAPALPETASVNSDSCKVQPEPEKSTESAGKTDSAGNTYICPNCGAVHNIPKKFCGKCGTKMEG